MESRIKAFGHPIHPMLIVFPLGLLAVSVIFDLVYLFTGQAVFANIAFWDQLAGILGGLLAALFGLLDWLTIPPATRAKAIGLMHGVGNVIVVALFWVSWLLRMGVTDHLPSTLALVCSFAGVLLALFTAWLGGELVYRLGMAVDRGANLDAVNSLSGKPARAPAGGAQMHVIPSTGSPEEEEPRRPD